MTRHWFAIASGLVLATLLATTTSAQVYNSPATTSGSGSELRPGWSREGLDPAAARGRYTISPASPASTQYVENSPSQGRSLLPSWFGWRKDKPAQQSNNQSNSNPSQNNGGKTGLAKPPSNQSRPTTNKTNPTNRPTEQMPADSLPPDPATMQEAQLPGLGGSPLPRKTGQSSNVQSQSNGTPSASASAQSSRSLPGKTPSITAPSMNSVRSASREPIASPSNTTSTTGTPSTSRNSPGRRTTPHITPEELRRELSGTFPVPATSGEATPRTAQADEQTQTEDNVEAVTGEADAVISDAPLTLPTTNSGSQNFTTPKAKPVATAQPRTSPSTTTESTPRKAADPFGATDHSKSANGSTHTLRVPSNITTPSAPQTARGKEAFGEALQVASGGDPNVLASNQTPVITIDIRGPKQIQVGREALYRVRLQNQGDMPAEGIIATVRVPSGAEVMNTSATQGMVQPSQDVSSKGQLQWQLARLDRKSDETLEIRLIPRESRPLELGVSWSLAAVASRAIVEVQEAKLQLEITGPNEVLFDKPQVFKLTLTNPGTGPAENVKIELMPPGGSQEAVTSHPLGDLAPGASQTVEVELTAREAGKMFVKATATAEGGLASDSAKEIFCRKPELEVDWRGPATKYAGTMATYFVRVRNPGTASADDVTVKATLPDGAEFTSASEGQTYDASQREVSWHVGSLAPGDDNYMELKCVLKSPGMNRVKMTAATASGNLTDSKLAETNVEAIADLKLDVSDPSGPVAVGTQAVYEIRIRNRGASAAKDINVVALFSEGIEPEQAEGATYSVADGRVTFKAIDELAAGRDVVLRIRAHATQPGTHVFRAEVLCRDLEIKLAAEETTRFYADDSPSDNEKAEKQATNRSDAFGPAVK
jgi:uncharacterized repeat protein (TIGR01451 family)